MCKGRRRAESRMPWCRGTGIRFNASCSQGTSGKGHASERASERNGKRGAPVAVEPAVQVSVRLDVTSESRLSSAKEMWRRPGPGDGGRSVRALQARAPLREHG